jgi:predicted site-specific integrase-resolvase
MHMNKLVPIGAAAKALGVSTSTLRRWEAADRLVPTRTEGGQRRYDVAALPPGIRRVPQISRKTVAYARVSSHDQREDLERQKQVLELYCASHGWTFEVVSDLGSGMNYHTKGLKNLLDVIEGNVSRLVLTHKDRLLRFGAELVFALCEARSVDVVVINQGADSNSEQELAGDVLEIITVFSARLHGSGSHRNQKLIDSIRKAAKEAQCS